MLSAALQLAYSTAVAESTGPATSDILSHLGQLCSFWDHRPLASSESARNEEISLFYQRCLDPCLRLLSLIHATVAVDTIREAREALERLVAFNAVLPLRKHFFERLAKSWKSQDGHLSWKIILKVYNGFSRIIEHSSQSMASASKLISVSWAQNASTLYDIAIRLVPKANLKKRQLEQPWLDALLMFLSYLVCPRLTKFEVIDGQIELLDPVIPSELTDRPQVIDSLLVTARRHTHRPSPQALSSLASSLLTWEAIERPWSCMAGLVDLDADVLVSNSGLVTTSFALDAFFRKLEISSVGLEDYTVILNQIIKPMLKGYARSRALKEFITRWAQYLPEALRKSAIGLPPTQEWSAVLVWQDEELFKEFTDTYSLHGTASLTKDLVLALQDDLQDLPGRVGSTLNTFSNVAIVNAVVESLQSTDITLDLTMENAIADYAMAALQKRSDYQGQRWRLWKLIRCISGGALLSGLCDDMSNIGGGINSASLHDLSKLSKNNDLNKIPVAEYREVLERFSCIASAAAMTTKAALTEPVAEEIAGLRLLLKSDITGSMTSQADIWNGRLEDFQNLPKLVSACLGVILARPRLLKLIPGLATAVEHVCTDQPQGSLLYQPFCEATSEFGGLQTSGSGLSAWLALKGFAATDVCALRKLWQDLTRLECSRAQAQALGDKAVQLLKSFGGRIQVEALVYLGATMDHIGSKHPVSYTRAEAWMDWLKLLDVFEVKYQGGLTKDHFHAARSFCNILGRVWENCQSAQSLQRVLENLSSRSKTHSIEWELPRPLSPFIAFQVALPSLLATAGQSKDTEFIIRQFTNRAHKNLTQLTVDPRRSKEPTEDWLVQVTFTLEAILGVAALLPKQDQIEMRREAVKLQDHFYACQHNPSTLALLMNVQSQCNQLCVVLQASADQLVTSQSMMASFDQIASLEDSLTARDALQLALSIDNSRLVLDHLPGVVNQKTIDTLLARLCCILSPTQTLETPQARLFRPDGVFDRICALLSSLLSRYRRRLADRHHLLLAVVQAMLKCLFFPGARAVESKQAALTNLSASFFHSLPSWLTATEDHLGGASAAKFSRLLSMICNPTGSAAKSSGKRKNNELNDETKRVKALAGQHMQYLVMEYARCTLDGEIQVEVKEKLVVGMYIVLDAMGRDVMRAMNAAMDASSRAIFKSLYDDWRGVLFIGIAAFLLTLRYVHTASRSSWQSIIREMPQAVGLGEWMNGSSGGDDESYYENPQFKSSRKKPAGADASDPYGVEGFRPGQAKAPGSEYSRALVIAKTKRENVEWIHDESLSNVRQLVYVVNDVNAEFTVPKNKGHEVMVYLTYIIDHYDDLPDISIFMHAHQYAWHDNELLNNDGLEMVKRLSNERVTREGYMNLRCHWQPGCPNWMHPGTVVEDSTKEEETVMAQAWAELFPEKPIPVLLSQPCCSQFALSKERIQVRTLERYKFWREWLLRTPMSDKISGRVWEYLWQVVFTDRAVDCPNQWTCYCDGYGVCFENEKDFDYWFEMKWQRRELSEELEGWKKRMGKFDGPKPTRVEEVEAEIDRLDAMMEDSRMAAIERGTNPSFRAFSAGRKWEPGDGTRWTSDDGATAAATISFRVLCLPPLSPAGPSSLMRVPFSEHVPAELEMCHKTEAADVARPWNAQVSTALAGAVVLKAVAQRPNFYSAAVYLSQSSANLLILTNLVFVLACTLLLGLQKLLYGPLRAIEVEQLYERGWFAVTETCLAMTIFRGEIGPWFLAMFFALLAGKVWQWIGEGRVEALEQQPPRNPRLFHTRLALSLGLSAAFDLTMLEYVVKQVMMMARPDMMVMFGFEFAVLSIMSLSTAARYALALVEVSIVREQKRKRVAEMQRERLAAAKRHDSRVPPRAQPGGDGSDDERPTLDEAREELRRAQQPIDDNEVDVEGWEARGRYIFYLDLATDFFKLVIYFSFFVILLIFYGLPLHIMRDVFLTTRSFFKRISDFIKYRTATRDMNERFPDATEQDIAGGDVCIICREEMRPHRPAGPDQPAPASPVAERMRPKKLPCGHILHFACLRSWLERQQRPPGQVARVFQFGPFRIGVGAARGNHMLEELQQQLHNGRPAQAEPADGNRPQQYGFGIRWDGLPRRHDRRRDRGSVREQLDRVEQQIQEEMRTLAQNTREYAALRHMQFELDRARSGRSARIATPAGDRLQIPAGEHHIQAGSPDLPPGMVLPEGWSMVPLRPAQVQPPPILPATATAAFSMPAPVPQPIQTAFAGPAPVPNHVRAMFSDMPGQAQPPVPPAASPLRPQEAQGELGREPVVADEQSMQQTVGGPTLAERPAEPAWPGPGRPSQLVQQMTRPYAHEEGAGSWQRIPTQDNRLMRQDTSNALAEATRERHDGALQSLRTTQTSPHATNSAAAAAANGDGHVAGAPSSPAQAHSEQVSGVHETYAEYAEEGEHAIPTRSFGQPSPVTPQPLPMWGSSIGLNGYDGPRRQQQQAQAVRGETASSSQGGEEGRSKQATVEDVVEEAR
ncbi:hypothetical protein DV737_g4005, partial [Chaetothyriales sp. CBS 132003]